MEKNKLIESGYICRDCAKANGARGACCHAYTVHMGKCSICGEEKYLGHTSDWDWPEQKDLERNREV